MILYLSGLGHFKKLYSFILENCPDVGVLCTFADPKEFYCLVEAGFKNIMVDSGAFSVSTKGKRIDIDKYIEFLKLNEEKITCSVVLDVIDNAQKSYDNWLYMRNKGIKNLIPVYHLGEDIKWLDLYCQETDFIGVGGIVGVTNWKINGGFLKRVSKRYPTHKIHIFGLNSYKALRMINAYSCDATTWLNGQKFAKLQHNGTEINLRQEPEKSIIWEQLKEWGVSYSEFAENKHDYNQLNKFNIKFLYDLIKNHKKIEVSEQEELF